MAVLTESGQVETCESFPPLPDPENRIPAGTVEDMQPDIDVGTPGVVVLLMPSIVSNSTNTAGSG